MSKLEEVKAETNRIFIATGAWHAGAKELELLAKALAAEVDARDEVIGRLLAILAPGDRPEWHESTKLAIWQNQRDLHARAGEIAGRTE